MTQLWHCPFPITSRHGPHRKHNCIVDDAENTSCDISSVHWFADCRLATNYKHSSYCCNGLNWRLFTGRCLETFWPSTLQYVQVIYFISLSVSKWLLSKGKMTNELWIGKDLEGSARGIVSRYFHGGTGETHGKSLSGYLVPWMGYEQSALFYKMLPLHQTARFTAYHI
jgi:hypothetical protein